MISPYPPTNPLLALLIVVVVAALFLGCENTQATETAEMFGQLYRSRVNEVWGNFNDARGVVGEVYEDRFAYILREDEPDWKPHFNARETREVVVNRLGNSLQHMERQLQLFTGLVPPDHEALHHEAGIAYMKASMEVGSRLVGIVNENVGFLRDFKQDLPPTLEEFLAGREANAPKAISQMTIEETFNNYLGLNPILLSDENRNLLVPRIKRQAKMFEELDYWVEEEGRLKAQYLAIGRPRP